MKKIDFGQIALKTAGLAAGSIGAAVVQEKFLSNMGQKVSPFIVMGIGIALPILLPKIKIAEHVGDGMIARGSSDAVAAFAPNLIPGYSGSPSVSGSDLPAMVYGTDITDIQLLDNPSVLSGLQEEGERQLVDSMAKVF